MLNSLIKSEFASPNFTAGEIVPKLQVAVKKILTGLQDFPYIVDGNEQMILDHLFAASLTYTRERSISHPILRFIQTYLQQKIIKKIRGEKVVLVIGAKFSELFALQEKLKHVHFVAIFGSVDSKDDARAQQDFLKAKRTLATATDRSLLTLASEFIKFYQTGVSNQFLTPKSYKNSTLKIDVAVAQDSLYDIAPFVLGQYFEHFEIKMLYGSMQFCPELKYSLRVHNQVLDTVWERSDDMVVMKHGNAASNGYVHHWKVLSAWNYCTFFDVNSFGMLMEIDENKGGYCSFSIARTNSKKFINVHRLPKAAFDQYRLFDSVKFVKYMTYDYFFVDRDKYDYIFNYCMRLTLDQFEPSRMFSYASGLKNKIIIGETLIQKNWLVSEDVWFKTVEFAILHTALARGEVYAHIINSVKISKSGGQKEARWVYFFRKLWNWLTKEDQTKLLSIIRTRLNYAPDYHEEYYSENDKGGHVLIANNLVVPVSRVPPLPLTTPIKPILKPVSKPIPLSLDLELKPMHYTSEKLPFETKLLAKPVLEPKMEELILPKTELLHKDDELNIYRANVSAIYDILRTSTKLSSITESKFRELLSMHSDFKELVLAMAGILPEMPEKNWRKVVMDKLKIKNFFPRNLLDFGGGNGDLAVAFAKSHCIDLRYVNVVDPNFRPDHEINYHRRIPAELLGIPSFDVIIIRMTVHHLENWKVDLTNLAKLLLPGGRMIITDHDAPKDLNWRLFQEIYHGVTIAMRGDLIKRSDCQGNYVTLEELKMFLATSPEFPGKFRHDSPVGQPHYTFNLIYTHVGESANVAPVKKFTGSEEEVKDYVTMMLNAIKTGAFDWQDPYQGLHDKVMNKLEKMHFSYDLSDLDVKVWDMVAGAGKTVNIMRNFDPDNDLYICHSGDLLVEFQGNFEKQFHRARKIPGKTSEAALLENLSKYKHIFIDECFTFGYSYLLMAFVLAPHSKFHLLGDHNQTSIRDGENRFYVNQKLQSFLDRFTDVTVNSRTLRFGEPLVTIMNDIPIKYNITTGRTANTLVTRSNERQRIKNPDLEICFSTATKDYVQNLTGKGITVRAAQGKSVKTANLYLNKNDLGLANERQLVIVALSRAADHLNLVELDAGMIERLRFRHDLIKRITEVQMDKIIAPEAWDISTEHVPRIDEIPIPHAPDVKFDPETLFANAKLIAPDNTQEAVEMTGGKETIPAVVATDKLPETVNRETKSMKKTAYGKKYYVASNIQTIRTLIRRAIQQNKNKGSFMPVNLFNKFKNLMVGDLNVTEINQVFYKKVLEVTKRNVENHRLITMDDCLDAYDVGVRAHLKQIDKTRGSESAYVDKVGQGILAWTTELNAAFCTWFRALEDLIVGNLKPNVIYANKLSDQDIERLMNENIKDWNQTINNDFQEFDFSQGVKTIKAEEIALKWFMDDEGGLKLYWAVRAQVKVISKILIYRNHFNRTSGEPNTLGGNSLLCAMIITAGIVDFKRFKGMIYKGDDSTIFMVGDPKTFWDPHVAKHILGNDAKTCISPIPEFCNHIYFGGKFFYNYQALAQKILSRNMEGLTFEQYQQSIFNQLAPWFAAKRVVEIGLGMFLNLLPSTVELLMQQIHAFTTVPWKDVQGWLETTRYTV
jgi:ubiquinone/menaquinone biosynthesis C-methylase UbiE